MQSTRPSSKSIRRHGAGNETTQTLEHDDPESAQASDSSPEILPGEPPSLPGDPAGGKMLGPSTPMGTPVGSGPVVAPPSLPAGGRLPVATPIPVAAEVGVKIRSAPRRMPSPVPSPPPSPGPASPAPATAAPAPVVVATAPPPPGPTMTAVPAVPAAVPAPSQPTAPEAADAIAESPEMIWYVRPPSGGQFGPASGELMKTWLSEGRVSADSLVWREGWRDWQEASAVFPKLRGNQIMDFLETVPMVNVAAAPAANVHRPKVAQPSDRNQIALLVVLSLAVIVLFVVFIFVLFQK
ncbi:MAG: DUF4339 domain-containing protein [Thermoguttaceae bacterium]